MFLIKQAIEINQQAASKETRIHTPRITSKNYTNHPLWRIQHTADSLEKEDKRATKHRKPQKNTDINLSIQKYVLPLQSQTTRVPWPSG